MIGKRDKNDTVTERVAAKNFDDKNVKKFESAIRPEKERLEDYNDLDN